MPILLTAIAFAVVMLLIILLSSMGYYLRKIFFFKRVILFSGLALFHTFLITIFWISNREEILLVSNLIYIVMIYFCSKYFEGILKKRKMLLTTFVVIEVLVYVIFGIQYSFLWLSILLLYFLSVNINTQVTEKNYNIKFTGRILNNILLVFFLFFSTANFCQIYVADSAIVTINNGATVISSGHVIESFKSTKSVVLKSTTQKNLASRKTSSLIPEKKKIIKSIKTPQQEASSKNSYYSNQLPVDQFVSSNCSPAKAVINIVSQSHFLKPSGDQSVSSNLKIHKTICFLYKIEWKESSFEFSYNVRPPPFSG